VKRYLFDSNALSLFIFRRQRVYERALAARRAGAVLGTGTPEQALSMLKRSLTLRVECG